MFDTLNGVPNEIRHIERGRPETLHVPRVEPHSSTEYEPVALNDDVSRDFLLFHGVCPLGFDEQGTLIVGVADGSQESALDDLSISYRSPVTSHLLESAELDLAIDALTFSSASQDGESLYSDTIEPEFAPDIEDLVNKAPVVRYVNRLLREAHDADASDVHLEQSREGIEARLRIDGLLTPTAGPPNGLGDAVVSRVKLLAELDIAERRRPQDGRMHVRTPVGDLDLRVSTVPALHGESVVLRLLERGRRPVELAELGMPPDIETRFSRAARRPHGLVLVTGPTGSGKTTTLYSALRIRDRAVEKLITVEDPVEYELPGVVQVPVRRATGVTFASALRSLLRQDPDVMLIGEMRDRETAEIAIQAALTGHFVFSTLHTKSAAGAIPRLSDFDVPGYLLAATLEGVLAQRLVRRVCEVCATRVRPEPDRVATLTEALRAAVPSGPHPRRLKGPFVRGAGCDDCRGTGYRGRIGLFEWIDFTPDLRRATSRGAGPEEVGRIISGQGVFRPLIVDGCVKIAAGITTIEEVIRVAAL